MELFVSSFLALPFALYALVVWGRRVRCRRAAELLRARFADRGLFAPPAIVGEDFEVEPIKSGKTFRTRVRVATAPLPGRFWLRPGFFSARPKWGEARVPATTNQRLFLWEVALPGGAEPSVPEQRELLAWLDPRALDDGIAAGLADLKVREIELSDGFVTASRAGILLDAQRLERLIAILHRIGPPRDRRRAQPLQSALSDRGWEVRSAQSERRLRPGSQHGS